MEDIDRRSALAFGLATAATLPALLTPTPASAQRYRPDEGREIAPGVRRVDLTKRDVGNSCLCDGVDARHCLPARIEVR